MEDFSVVGGARFDRAVAGRLDRDHYGKARLVNNADCFTQSIWRSSSRLSRERINDEAAGEIASRRTRWAPVIHISTDYCSMDKPTGALPKPGHPADQRLWPHQLDARLVRAANPIISSSARRGW